MGELHTECWRSQIRTFAAVLFRRIATKTRKAPDANKASELFLSLQHPQKNVIREKLLRCLELESQHNVRNKVGDAVAEIARQYTEEGTMPGSFVPNEKWKLTQEQASNGRTCWEHFFSSATPQMWASEKLHSEYSRLRLAS